MLLPTFFNMTFRVGGILIKITWHFLALLTFMLSLETPNVLYAVIFSLLHETGHLCAMITLGSKPLSVSLELTGMNIHRVDETGISLAKEIIIAFAGPFVNLMFFAFFVLLYAYGQNSKFLDIASVNLILSVFNLVPVKGLDGGKILYYSVSKIFSYKIAGNMLAASSVFFIVLLVFYGVYVLYATKYNFTMLIIALMLSLSMFSKEEC